MHIMYIMYIVSQNKSYLVDEEMEALGSNIQQLSVLEEFTEPR